jgi:parallel beta-helix repeat protein
MKHTLLIIFISLILALLNVSDASLQELRQSAATARTFYVATNGNDQWSGTLSAPDSSRNDGPFATLQKARNAIRELKHNGSKDAFTVLVRGGIYQLSETFVLELEDSGTESAPTVFRAFPNERPILSGNRTISNFEPFKGKILKANLTEIIKESNSERQLFANGKRQILARYPNFDPLDPIGGGYLYVERPAKEGSKSEFRYQDDSMKEWPNLQAAEVVIFPGNGWRNNIVTVLGIDRTTRTITLSKETSHEIKSGNRYYLQNLLEELDSPGEWYFDCQGKILYYWPSNDAVLETVTIPVLKTIVEIRGEKNGNKYDGTPSNIRFEGFTMDGCKGSAIVVNGAKSTVIGGNTIYNAGSRGIEIQDGFNNLAFGNNIYDVGEEGIRISGGDRKTLTPANNRAENNYIHHIGVFIKNSSGITCGGVGNVISHNLIHSTPRMGIWLYGNDNLVEYNHIHHVNMETDDSGIIYCSGGDWTQRGNVIRHNYFHDSGGYGRQSAAYLWQTPFDTYGIYLDDWFSGTMVYGNIVANTASGGIFIHSGRDNIVVNNVIIKGGLLGQMVYSAWPPSHPTAQKLLPEMYAKIAEMNYTKYPQLSSITDAQTGAKMSGNSFIRNIVYYSDKDAMLYGIYNDIDLTTTVSDYNVIYHAGAPLLVSFTKALADRQWQSWQDKGLDRHSLIADPLFADVEKGDFHLSPNSPALKMGFKPIPIDKIGPYQDPLRATWPIH